MSDADLPIARPDTRLARPVRRWGPVVKWVSIAFVIGGVGWFGFAVTLRTYRMAAAERDLAAVVGELDTSSPGWRLADIQAASEARFPPPGDNSAAVVARVVALLPTGWESRATDNVLPNAPPDNHRQSVADLEAIRGILGGCDEAVAEGQRLTAMPAGGTRLEVKVSPIATLIPHVLHTRTAATLLDLQARILSADGRPDEALQHSLTILNAGRSIGDEPFLISQLVRFSAAIRGAESTMRTLALGEPTARLAELQSEFQAEAGLPLLLVGIRGERALQDRLLENLVNGTLDDAGRGATGSPPDAALTEWLVRPIWIGTRAKSLRVMSRAVKWAEQPYPRRRETLADLDRAFAAVGDADPGSKMISLLLPACGKISDADARRQAALLTAATGLACERYRRTHDRWPDSLSEIPTSILPAVPTDPCTGGSLLFRRLPDGVIIYSVGTNLADDGGNIAQRADLPGTDIGFRLWDPDQRGLPAIDPDAPEVAPPPREVP